jgi:nucleotide-binding universal stress UspA family protein
MIERIIVPLNGSEAAEAAVGPAENIARRFGAGMTLLRAYGNMPDFTFMALQADRWPGPEAALSPAMLALTDTVAQQREAAHAYLEQWAERLRARGRSVELVLRRAPAEIAILEEGERSPTSLVVMGTRRRGALQRLLFGSTSGVVLQKAGVPVMLVHPDEQPVHRRGQPVRPTLIRPVA